MDLFKYVSVIKYAFNLMTNTERTLTFLFPVVLNNIVVLNDCASATAKLSEALEEILPYFFDLFLVLSKTNRSDSFSLPSVFALNGRIEVGREGQD